GRSASTVAPTAAAGTIIHTVRGFASNCTSSVREFARCAPSRTASSAAAGWRSYTTQRCPPRSRRCALFDPTRPRPIIPTAIASPSLWRGGGCAARAIEHLRFATVRRNRYAFAAHRVSGAHAPRRRVRRAPRELLRADLRGAHHLAVALELVLEKGA